MVRGNSAIVRVTQTYPWILFALQRAFGGTVAWKAGATGQRREQWEWYLYGGKARELCQTLAPYLVEKQRQAEIVWLCSGDLLGRAQKESLQQELKDLKRVNYH